MDQFENTLWLQTLTSATAQESAATEWIWDGYIPIRAITLLTSKWKTGKSTLVSLLLARMHAGGELIGRAVRQATALVVSEEPNWLWMQRHRRLNIGDSHFFCHLPFSEKPTVEHFERFIATVHANCRERNVRLVVIDPLINVLPEFCENNPDILLPALQQFRNLADRGIAVLILHHPKNDHANSTTPRGCGVLPAFVDALMNLDTVDDADFADRRRRLRFASRFDVPRSDRLIILNEAGTDYQELPNEPAAKEPNGLSIVEAILAEFEHPLTSTEIMDNWPERNPSPHPATLRRWLDRLVTAGRAEKFEPTKGNAGRWGTGGRGKSDQSWPRKGPISPGCHHISTDEAHV